jgi:[acyl-carrier-protein] S-malonyltransferase
MDKTRCKWCNLANPLYVKYHDEEWCVPTYDDAVLFEFIILEAFQAGLSWETILNKRENFRESFDDFKPEVIMNYDDAKIEEICASISKPGYVVVPANYNNPGQLVISGNVEAINEACEVLKAAGAKRALPLPVGGAFHSPLMQPAKDELQAAIEATTFSTPKCPVYQNVDAQAHTNPEEIKQNLIAQLTAPVKWTYEVQAMVAAGATDFTECGPGKALQGMIAKIDRNVTVHGIA